MAEDDQQQPADQSVGGGEPTSEISRADKLDATQAHEPVDDAGTAASADDAVAATGRDDETTVLPATGTPGAATPPGAGKPGAGTPSAAGTPGTEGRWAARAGVPPRAAPPTEFGATEQWQEPPSGRSWWLPAVLAIVALLLLGALGAGIWLIQRALDRGEPGQPPPVSPTANRSASPTGTAAPTTAGPSPTPSPTTPAQVAVPTVVGSTEAVARQALERAGLVPQVSTRVQEGVPAGIVLEVLPATGSLVPPGSSVTLIVAAAPLPPTSPPPSPPSSEPTLPTGG